jgi:NADPH-dependent 2,4-dienoyl-CoA reductase/sulfur reductase-like enzyme
MRRMVIVGQAGAGHRAAQAARRDGFDGELIVVGDEEHLPYDRPPLSKQLLAGSIEHHETFYKHDEHDAEWKLGSPATSLDIATNTVTLASGEQLTYDGLVLATGPARREWPNLPARWLLRCATSTTRTRERRQAGRRAARRRRVHQLRVAATCVGLASRR